MNRWTFLAVLSTLTLAGLGCQTTADDTAVAAHADVRGIEHFAVAPFNLAVPLPRELQAPALTLPGRLRTHLESRGQSVSVIDDAEGRQLWADCVREVRIARLGEEVADSQPPPGRDSKADPRELGRDYDAAAVLFAQRAAAQTGAQTVILPSLAYRSGRRREGSMRWDGVVRNYQGPSALDERVLGVSIHVFIYSSDGVQVYADYGGLDFIHRYDPEKGVVLQDELLSKAEHVRQGIAVALDGYLAQPRR